MTGGGPKAKIAGTAPIEVQLEKGQQYGFCTCGHSEKQPFCDGLHKEHAPEFKSLKFCSVKDQTVFLCMCKHSRKFPFCDGSHSRC